MKPPVFVFYLMRNALPKTLCLALAILISAILVPSAYAQQQQQTKCLTPADQQRAVQLIENGPPNPQIDKKLAKEILKIQEKYREVYRDAALANFENKGFNNDLLKIREKNDARLCEIIKTSGWPTKMTVGFDAADAVFYLLRSSDSLPFQIEMLPVLNAALSKELIAKNSDLAGLIDLIRVRSGERQIFGTQYSRHGDFLMLLPLRSVRDVDQWRKAYDMKPLSQAIKESELNFRKPIIKSWTPVAGTLKKGTIFAGKAPALLPEAAADDDDEVIKVASSIVSLPVFVYSPKNAPSNMLSREDFQVFEDGVQQRVEFFSAADTPFDLVLLLDLSGSTEGKLKLIKNATNKFIQAKRPGDRVAIVSFATNITTVSPLTSDSGVLLEGVKNMSDQGASKVWDALKFTLDKVVGPKTPERRRAVVFFTDGVDNALYGHPGGSKISFADLFEEVKKNEATIFPIYLDTESYYGGDIPMAYRYARSILNLLADETGGQYYKAKSIDDLDGIYTQVHLDLSRVYTIGYLPTNENRDGTWRELQVKVPGRPELTVKTKLGYYAK